jgi:hypothetical protein
MYKPYKALEYESLFLSEFANLESVKTYILKMIRALPSGDFGAWKGSQELARLAKRYSWWKTVEQAMENPEQIVAQVMHMGEWDDVCRLVDYVEDEGLCRLIKHAEIGMFNERSWTINWDCRRWVAFPRCSQGN